MLPSYEVAPSEAKKSWVVRIHDETDELVSESWYDSQAEADAFIEGFVKLSELQSNDGIIDLDE